jgi:pimeloyl-ACP methyl ester carboxylesterase
MISGLEITVHELNTLQLLTMYQVHRPSRSEFVPIRDHLYHVRLWGSLESLNHAPALVLLHGWMDVSASFQFLVDAMSKERLIIAPDWRGFGLTKRNSSAADSWGVDHYVFADYLGDLDALVEHYLRDSVFDLLGHSMGGNVSMVYAGVRPNRVRTLINLEGFGMPSTRAAQAPGRYAKWLDEIKALKEGGLQLKGYKSASHVAERLMKNNPRITPDKALWLAHHWSKEHGPEDWRLWADPAHKVTSAQLYRADEASEIHKRITAPVLCVTAEDDSLAKAFGQAYTMAEFYERMKSVARIEFEQLMGTGHMLHHDQPLELAKLIERFLDHAHP